jgi:hypothetical protein
MKKPLVWLLAFIITAASAVYQRRTGPTYELRGTVEVGGVRTAFELPRSAETTADCEVSLAIAAPEVTGRILYRRFKTADPWSEAPLLRQADRLVGYLPKQPPAGKLDYRVVLNDGSRDVPLTGETPVVIRFKGHVPLGVLLAHVIIMFAAMLLSTRAGLAAFDKTDRPRVFAFWTIVLLFVGGFVLGPLVQKLAFGTWWAGVPLGWDLTDNKTLIAAVAWAFAAWRVAGGRGARVAITVAALVTLVVFAIPHSVWGSEAKWG